MKKKLSGIYLPIITPFLDDEVDYASYKKMIDFYLTKGIAGIVPLGTTGESPTVSEYEYEKIIEKTVEYVNKSVPIYVGFGGNYTNKLVKQIKILEKYDIEGILSVSPYYNRPDQRGIYEHFAAISNSTDLDIILYNIPYRTGRNIENETIHKLAGLRNIIGIKDSCGDVKQTMELLLNRPEDFSILTGEDALFYSTLALGGDGGILASAHIQTDKFVEVFNLISQNNHKQAFKVWKELADIIALLFLEPNPAPLKYCLNKLGMIQSAEARLPIMPITEGLQAKLDKFIK